MVLGNMEKIDKGILQATKSASNLKQKTNKQDHMVIFMVKQGHFKGYIWLNYVKHNVTS